MFVGKVKGGLPLGHIVARRLVLQVHGRGRHGGVPQDAAGHLLDHVLAALAQGRRHGHQLVCGSWDIRAQVLDIPPQGLIVLLIGLSVQDVPVGVPGQRVRYLACAVRQPLYIPGHWGHPVLQLRRRLGAFCQGGGGGHGSRRHGRQPYFARLGRGVGQRPQHSVGLLHRCQQALVHPSGNADGQFQCFVFSHSSATSLFRATNSPTGSFR